MAHDLSRPWLWLLLYRQDLHLTSLPPVSRPAQGTNADADQDKKGARVANYEAKIDLDFISAVWVCHLTTICLALSSIASHQKAQCLDLCRCVGSEETDKRSAVNTNKAGLGALDQDATICCYSSPADCYDLAAFSVAFWLFILELDALYSLSTEEYTSLPDIQLLLLLVYLSARAEHLRVFVRSCVLLNFSACIYLLTIL